MLSFRNGTIDEHEKPETATKVGTVVSSGSTGYAWEIRFMDQTGHLRSNAL